MSQMPSTSGSRSSLAFPRIASPRTPPSAVDHQRVRSRSAAISATRTIAAASSLVEDLAVQVDVMPDEVRVERGEQRPSERDAPVDAIRVPIA